MEDKIMNTVEEVMENDAMTEVRKTGMKGGLKATIATVSVLALGTVAAFVGKKLKKRKDEKSHDIVEANATETVADGKVVG